MAKEAHVTLTLDASALEAGLKQAERIFARWSKDIAAQEARLDLKLKAWGREIAALEKRAKKATRT